MENLVRMIRILMLGYRDRWGQDNKKDEGSQGHESGIFAFDSPQRFAQEFGNRPRLFHEPFAPGPAMIDSPVSA